jgi:hypothetical protein
MTACDLDAGRVAEVVWNTKLRSQSKVRGMMKGAARASDDEPCSRHGEHFVGGASP